MARQNLSKFSNGMLSTHMATGGQQPKSAKHLKGSRQLKALEQQRAVVLQGVYPANNSLQAVAYLLS